MMKSKILLWCFLLLCSLWGAKCAKILTVISMPAHSHHTLGFRIAKELADRGHQVTAITPYPQKGQIKNYKEISIQESIAVIDNMKKQLFGLESIDPITNMKFVFDLCYEATLLAINNSRVQTLLKSNEEFDLIIVEHLLNEALIGLGHRFNAPVILIGSLPACSFNNHLVANPAPSSYIPDLLGEFTKHMTFWERTTNFLNVMLYDFMVEWYHLPRYRELFNKYISSVAKLDDYLYNVSLIFLNSHVSVADPVPHVPNMIEIGGFHVKPPKKLPDDLQKYLDGAKDGAILFSMGSNLKSADLHPQVLDSFLKAFSKIKQKVLWKFEADLPNLPPNVQIMKWIPQNDVLAHPNVRAFISHGGLLGTTETIYHGVPIIGVPVFGDQKMNVAAAVARGYAVSVPLSELTEEKLSKALKEIISNPKYRETAQHRSRLMHDQPQKPIDKAMFWIEHVLRFKGAPHLRSAALDLKWYQREMIDIFAFLGLSILTLVIITCFIIKKLVGFVCNAKGTVSKHKKNT